LAKTGTKYKDTSVQGLALKPDHMHRSSSGKCKNKDFLTGKVLLQKTWRVV